MLIENRTFIQGTLDNLRREIGLASIRLSEDVRNHSLCEKLTELCQEDFTQACGCARDKTREGQFAAIRTAEDGLNNWLKIVGAINGKALDGKELPQEKRITLHPAIVGADDRGEYEMIKIAGGHEYKNHTPTIPFKEIGAVRALLERIGGEACAELTSYGGKLPIFEELYHRYRSDKKALLKESVLGDLHYARKLQVQIKETMMRLGVGYRGYGVPPEPQSNRDVAAALHHFSDHMHIAAGDWLSGTLAADLGNPPSTRKVPAHAEVIQGFDTIFQRLYELLHSLVIDRLVPPRDTQACGLGMAGSIQQLKVALTRTVQDMKRQGDEFPGYDSVAARGHRR